MKETGKPKGKISIHALNIAQIGLFAALMSAGARINIPGPIVPFSPQLFLAVLCGVLLGAKKGVTAMGVYVALGLAGAPIFTNGGGFHYVLQPTFGYLLGFILAAFLAGIMSDAVLRRDGKLKFGKLILISALCIAADYLCGAVYYAAMMSFYLGTPKEISFIMMNFVVPFMLTDGLWCLVIASVAPRLKKALARYGQE